MLLKLEMPLKFYYTAHPHTLTILLHLLNKFSKSNQTLQINFQTFTNFSEHQVSLLILLSFERGVYLGRSRFVVNNDLVNKGIFKTKCLANQL